MRNIILLAHISLDGFMAGPGGDMSFITVDNEMVEHTHPLIHDCDTALYGRTTYQMMAGYWPDLVDSTEAAPHEREHAKWYVGVHKVVASRTLRTSDPTVTVLPDNIPERIAALKAGPGGPIMMFASPTLAHTLAAHALIDDWILHIQPVALGRGLPLFEQVDRRTQLDLKKSTTFTSGVIAARYTTRRKVQS